MTATSRGAARGSVRSFALVAGCLSFGCGGIITNDLDRNDVEAGDEPTADAGDAGADAASAAGSADSTSGPMASTTSSSLGSTSTGETTLPEPGSTTAAAGSDTGIDDGSSHGTTSGGEVQCGDITATVRDFAQAHPDFESFGGSAEATVGLVLPQLGSDGTPQYNAAYAGQVMITSEETFSQWYHDVPDVNVSFPIALPLVSDGGGGVVFDSAAFFPIDGLGFGNEGNPHNFHFTTEVRTRFIYEGGEVLTFRGDDDLWIFIDGRLALDLGGLHAPLEGTIDLDTLGLQPGSEYAMDIFHAERHTSQSNFRLTTTIDCFEPEPQ